jgi:glucosamine-6-phosphate deaminase
MVDYAKDPLFKSLEKIPTHVFPHPIDVNKYVAQMIAAKIREKFFKKEICVLRLATGSTPTGLHDELKRMHKE